MSHSPQPNGPMSIWKATLITLGMMAVLICFAAYDINREEREARVKRAEREEQYRREVQLAIAAHKHTCRQEGWEWNGNCEELVAWVHEKHWHWQEAVECYERAAKLGGYIHDPWLRQAECYDRMGLEEQAAARLRSREEEKKRLEATTIIKPTNTKETK